jgi:hypothetical protein
MVYTYWLWYPPSQTLQTTITIFGQHKPSIASYELVQHSQARSCESSIQP